MSIDVINFVCPHCGEDLLDEVSNAKVRYTLISIEKQSNNCVDTEADTSDPIIDLEGVSHYICACCLAEIEPNTPEDLYAWLGEHNMLQKV
jgi:hypothetical protein